MFCPGRPWPTAGTDECFVGPVGGVPGRYRSADDQDEQGVFGIRSGDFRNPAHSRNPVHGS